MITNTKKRRAIAAAALVVASAGLFAGSQMASANVGTSGFEGNDGNTVVNTGGNKDWNGTGASAAPNLTIGTDQPSGSGDNSFTSGSKEDEVDVVIGLGSIPNNKADIGKFGIASETLPNGNVMMYLAWSRVTLTGTTNFDFEINKLAQPNMALAPGQPDRAIHLIRSVNDLLVNYDLPPGATTNPTLSIRKWTGTTWGPAVTLNGGNSEGRLNAAPVVFGGVTYPAAQFGEAAIDLTGSGIIPNQNNSNAACVSFGSAYVKSRASSSFSAQMKDYVAPVGINLSTCGAIKIVKVTDPATDTTTQFPFKLTGGASALNKSFNLAGGGSDLTQDVKAGNGYVASEIAPAGWSQTSATCDNGTPANIVVVKGVTTTCTFTNTQARGSITLIKHVDPAGTTFTFHRSFGGDVVLGDGASALAGNLLPGTYSANEDVPAGWTQTDAHCTDPSGDSTPGSIKLAAGENITCEFTNTARGTITIIKNTDPDGSAQVFHFQTSYDAAGVDAVDNDGGHQSGALVPGSYSVSEDAVEGWASSGTCDDDDSADPATLTLDPGENITCIFDNTEGASITIIKEVVPGGDLGQSFSFTNDIGMVDPLFDGEDFTATLAPNATYSVTEDAVLNWRLVNDAFGDPTDVVCSDDSLSSAISLQAGEHVICKFVNEWQVGGIQVTKTAKDASQGPGDHPLGGVQFIVHDINGIAAEMTTDANGVACVNNFGFGNYTVEEVVPDGYAAQELVEVTIDSVSNCASVPEVATFSNIPLTDVTIKVDSLVGGSTNSRIVCTDVDGNVLDTITAGDGSLYIPNLKPTDPIVATLNCQVFIDP